MRLTRAGATTARLERLGLMVLWSPLTLEGVQGRCRVDRKKYLETQLDDFASLVEDLPESEVPAGMDRKKLLSIIGAGGAALSLPALLAACGGGGGNESGSGVGNYPETPKWKWVFVNHVTTNPFFVPTQYGIEDMGAIFNTEHQWTGSGTSDGGQMVSSMNTAISLGAAEEGARRRDPGHRLQRGRAARQRERATRVHRPGPVRLGPEDGGADRRADPERRRRRLHRDARLASNPAAHRRG